MTRLLSKAPVRSRVERLCPRWLAASTIAILFQFLAFANAEAQSVVAQTAGFDLARVFDLGASVIDTNADGVPDRLNASLLLGPSPTPVEIAAAAEVASRLGFETMAMDLPIARGVSEDGITIVVGRGGLAESGLRAPGVDPVSLDSGEGVVAVVTEDDRRWVLVLGGDDVGLLVAARLLSGVLPHTHTASGPSLERVREDLIAVLAEGEVEAASVELVQARARISQPGIERLVVEITVPEDEAEAAERVLRAFPDDEAEEDRLAQPGLVLVEARLGTAVVRLAGRAPPDAPGPVSGRPGSGAKGDMDLSNLFTNDGLLGDSDSNLIPDRVDAMLAPGTAGTDGLPELSGRLGLESTGLVVPLVELAGSIDRASSRPTLVLTGSDNVLTRSLADSGKVDTSTLDPGEGLLRVVSDAFGSKSALVVTGRDEAGAERALDYLARTYPNLSERGKDRPTLDDVERMLWSALSGHTPEGQAAAGVYELERLAQRLDSLDLVATDVTFSVERADPRLRRFVLERARTLFGPDVDVDVRIDDRDVRFADAIYEDERSLPSEVARFRELLEREVVPAVRAGDPVRLHARLSEPPELRRALEQEARDALVRAGADAAGTEVVVLSAFKQGYSWLYEVVRPRIEGADFDEVRIRFRRNDPPEEWPQQAMHTPVRWLHEIFPIDEVLASELDLDLDQIVFEEVEKGPIYEVEVTDASGATVLRDSFDPKWVLRPYFDRFRDYEQVRVTTGWMTAVSGGRTVVDQRIRTDPEAFWDHYQERVLPALYDYVMNRHEGLPQGGDADAPYFGELTVELQMSEPDYRLGIDNEIHSTMDALHEEIYFGTLEFFDLIGRNARGQGLTAPGRIIPVMHPRGDGHPPRARIKATGFATPRPSVMVAYRERSGRTGEVRQDIPRTTLLRPSARAARIRADGAGLSHVALRVRVDTDADVRDSLLTHAPPRQVDRTMVSAEQVTATLGGIEALRAEGMYASALALPGLGTLEVWAEWTHEEDETARRTSTLAANGVPGPLPDAGDLVPDGWSYAGERLVQWDTPIPPREGHEILGKMGEAFEEATVYKVGNSYLGKQIWAMDLMPPIEATHWSHAKATTFKPTVVYSAREHANEVSSTSHVLRHAELILTDSATRRKLDRVNVIIHPFTNPDGAQLAYDLYGITPDYILHAGYLGSLGQGATSGSDDDHPIYPEAPIRDRIWSTWLPDVFLNPHGYPSHQVVQLFSEFSGLVRRGRVTERNWGLNKGWFMPGFGYVDDPRFPRHKDAAFEIRDYITDAINDVPGVADLNRRAYDRYDRYGARFDPEVFRIPLTDGVLIEMPLKGSTGQGGGFNPRVTVWSGVTEAPDETAYGPWMELVASAGLAWDRAILDYLADGEHEVERAGSTFFGGVTLRMNRPRPPGGDDDEEEEGGGDGDAPPPTPRTPAGPAIPGG
ncbi:MAG: M14 family metallopeptidase [Gemmatimonadota bacterium]